MTEANPTPRISAQRFREVMAHVPTSVCVAAAITEDGPVGLTLGSFVSVSLEPPLVGVLVANTSTSWPRIAAAGRFCISVLGDTHPHLSRRFAVSGADKFGGIEWDRAPSGSPRLPDAVAWIDCTLHSEYPAGDHRFALGRVVELSASPAAAPLVFLRGQLCRVSIDERQED